MSMSICRRASNTECTSEPNGICEECKEKVFIENGMQGESPILCIQCAGAKHPETVMFVELPPDEFGHRSLAKTITEILAAGDGEWHKRGVWHNAKIVLENQE